MHIHSLNDWQHSHRFNAADTHGERNTKRVILLTLFMIVGALIITKWSYGLLVDTGKVLLDRDVNQEAIAEIKSIIESDSDNRISDIHVWRVGPHHLSAIISIVTHFPKSPGYYKNLLSAYDEISHVTVEVNKCEGEPCIIPNPQLI